MTMLSRLIITIVLACAIAPTSAHPSQSESAAPLTTVFAHVEPAAGTSWPTLTRNDFEIVSDGAATSIELFSADIQPLSVILLVDVSLSMEGLSLSIPNLAGRGSISLQGLRTRAESKESIERFINNLHPGDVARIGSIAREPSLGPGFSGNRRDLLKAADTVVGVRDADKGGPSPVWDALASAVAALEPRAGRKVVILVTDGRATGNRISLVEAAERAATANVAVNIVARPSQTIVEQSTTTASQVRPELPLQRIADFTGGLCLMDQGLGPDRRGATFVEILTAMRQSYALGFRGAAGGQPHQLQVRVRPTNSTARSRRRY